MSKPQMVRKDWADREIERVQAMITAWQDAAASDHAHAQRQAERAEQAEARAAQAEAQAEEYRQAYLTKCLALRDAEGETRQAEAEAAALRALIGRIQGALDTAEDGDDLVDVARGAHQVELEAARAALRARAGQEGGER
jgi:hypothetical protein